MTRTFTSREFNQNASAAKRAAQEGPVFITDRDRPSHVLMTVADYERIRGRPMSLAEALHDPASAHIDLPLEPRTDMGREVDAS